MLMDAVSRIVTWFELKKEGKADGWMLADGIVSCVFSLILRGSTALQLMVDVAIAYVAAIWILTIGIIRIVHAFKLRKVHKELDTKLLCSSWGLNLCFGILQVLFGILSLMNPSVIMAAMGVFIGLGIIVSGANLVTEAAAA